MKHDWFSQDLHTEYDALKLIRRQRLITASQYKKGVEKLQKADDRAFNKAEDAKLKAKEAKAKAERAKARALKAKANAIKTGSSKYYSQITDFTESWFFFKDNFKGTAQVIATILTGEGKELDINITLSKEKRTSKAFDSLYNSARSLAKITSGDPLVIAAKSRFIISPLTNVAKRSVKQSFKEGNVNCFISPIINLINEKIEDVKSKDTLKKYRRLSNLACRLEKEYRESGVPEDKVEEICKSLSISITLSSFESSKVYNKTARWSLKFLNSKLNHVELGQFVLVGDIPTVVNESQMTEIIKTNWPNVLFEGIYKDKKPNLIRTLNGSYCLNDPKSQMIKDMNEKYNIYDKAVDCVKYPALSNFLKEGYVVNSTPLFLDLTKKPVCNLDMRKAYAQFKACPYYNGFPGKIHTFVKFDTCPGKQFLKDNLGMYEFQVLPTISYNYNFLTKLGITIGCAYVRPSPEILLLMKMGLNIRIKGGAWGSKFDMDFSEEFIESGVFREYSGRLGMVNYEKVYNFPGDLEFAEYLQGINQIDDKIYHKDGLITVYRKKDQVYSVCHIAAFITSYTRINMILKMIEIGVDTVTMVMLDGIYTTKQCKDDKLFKVKPIVPHNNSEVMWYSQAEDNSSSFTSFDGVVGSTHLLGAGGSGKSHYVLESGRFHNVLYVSPTRMLGFKMAEKTGCKWTTLCKFAGMDGDDKTIRNYLEETKAKVSVVFFDEQTMCDADMMAKAVEICKLNGIMYFIAGDMEGEQWLQTRSGDGCKWSNIYKSDLPVKKFMNDYRAKDSKLKEFKASLRQYMREIFTDGGQEDTKKIEEWFIKNVNITEYWDAISEFKKGDMWIASTNNQSKRLLVSDVCSGFRITKPGKCSDDKFRSRGEIVDCDVGSTCEKRGSITTHSCQGLTLNCKTFISIHGAFDYAMLYTAISRVENWDQLVFVGA